MAILIDPPHWPAHQTLWSHLVSDTSYDELHAFAAKLQLPRRGFDLDHYDVPKSLYAQAVVSGARPVAAREVVHRLRDSGLRVRQVEKAAVQPVRRREYLHAEWRTLGTLLDLHSEQQWITLGGELITRWNEPHRRYHNEAHLEHVLLSLNHLSTRGEHVSPVTLLAAWFHDAVYRGVSGSDEQESASLATHSLSGVGLDPSTLQQVSDIIVSTTPALDFTHVDEPLGHLLDADLSIFAASQSRYATYAAEVRNEYQHVPTATFAISRAKILSTYLASPTIYHTQTAQQLWEEQARLNLANEIASLTELPLRTQLPHE